MGKKLKIAIIAMLGFSTACSTAKKSRQSTEPEQPQPQPQPAEVVPRIKVMYGVRSPYPVAPLQQEQQSDSQPTQTIPADGTQSAPTDATKSE